MLTVEDLKNLIVLVNRASYVNLNEAKAGFRGEVILAETLEKMIERGIMIYGCEIEGRWLECGNVKSWLQSNLFLAKKFKLF